MAEQAKELQELEAIRAQSLAALEGVDDEAGLEAWRIAHLGRSAPVMQVFGRLGQAPKELRPRIGQAANQVKQALEAALAERQETVKADALRRSLESEQLDISLPGRTPVVGRLHITNRVLREIYRIWGDMGFQVYRSREVETDEMNFGLLNMPPHHPARDMWDTFHTTTPGVVLRTHTSPGQIHVMRESAPNPVRVILPGMCYRYEQISARSEIQFNQVEGIAIGENITLGDLKGTLENFCRRMYGDGVRTRFRPSYFPFTELPDLQVFRMVGDPRQRDDPSYRAAERRVRSQPLHRVRLRHGPRARGHPQIPD
jgi:phenylalanyl-tRNA synthetase alpha chain